MIFVLIVLGILNAAFAFLALAAAGRAVRSQVIFENVVSDRLDGLTEQVSELSDTIDMALDCLVTRDARLNEQNCNLEVHAVA